MKIYLINKPDINPFRQNIVELDSTDNAPNGAYVNLPDGTTILISREYMDFYSELLEAVESHHNLYGMKIIEK